MNDPEDELHNASNAMNSFVEFDVSTPVTTPLKQRPPSTQKTGYFSLPQEEDEEVIQSLNSSARAEPAQDPRIRQQLQQLQNQVESLSGSVVRQQTIPTTFSLFRFIVVTLQLTFENVVTTHSNRLRLGAISSSSAYHKDSILNMSTDIEQSKQDVAQVKNSSKIHEERLRELYAKSEHLSSVTQDVVREQRFIENGMESHAVQLRDINKRIDEMIEKQAALSEKAKYIEKQQLQAHIQQIATSNSNSGLQGFLLQLALPFVSIDTVARVGALLRDGAQGILSHSDMKKLWCAALALDGLERYVNTRVPRYRMQRKALSRSILPSNLLRAFRVGRVVFEGATALQLALIIAASASSAKKTVEDGLERSRGAMRTGYLVMPPLFVLSLVAYYKLKKKSK